MGRPAHCWGGSDLPTALQLAALVLVRQISPAEIIGSSRGPNQHPIIIQIHRLVTPPRSLAAKSVLAVPATCNHCDGCQVPPAQQDMRNTFCSASTASELRLRLLPAHMLARHGLQLRE